MAWWKKKEKKEKKPEVPYFHGGSKCAKTQAVCNDVVLHLDGNGKVIAIAIYSVEVTGTFDVI